MPPYIIHITPEAEDDMDNLYDHIACVYMAPDTAANYLNGIRSAIHSLRIIGDTLAFTPHQSLRTHYGPFIRTCKYKKMVIIYEVIANVVVVYRVIAGSLIQ